MKGKNRNKKGLSPIIAIILLLMMTVAAAGAAFFWFIRIQSETQGGTESYIGQLSEKVSSRVNVLKAVYSGGDLYLYLQNLGNIDIPVDSSNNVPTTTWILSTSDGSVICSADWEGAPSDCSSGCNDILEINEIQEVVLDLTSTCAISSETTYPNGTLFSFVADFSGKASTGGQFIK